MAKATARKVGNTPAIELFLSAREASVLSELFMRIGGDPKGPRGDIDNVLGALISVDVERLYQTYAEGRKVWGDHGTIFFPDKW